MFGNSKKNLQDEDTKFKPESPYASAKTLGYWTTKNYRDNFKIFASTQLCLIMSHREEELILLQKK